MSEARTESSILDNIPGLSDQGTEGSTTESADSGGATTSAPAAGAEGGGRSSAQPGAAPTDAAVKQRRHDGLVEVPNPQNPNTRDLVDPISGRVVAQGGIERRVFEEGQRHARENVQLKRQLQQAQQQVGGSNAVMQEAQRLNISPEQHQVAIRVMSDFMTDPVKTLEYLVSEVKSKGYAIPFLENGVTQGMDMAAIQRMIESKMAPITQQHTQQQEHARVMAQAQNMLDTFLGKHSEANENIDTLGEMMQARPGLGLEDAYLLMVKWAVQNGLDHTRSLKQQIAAQREQPPQRQQPTTRPLPGPRSAQQTGARVNEGGMFSENASWSDIIRQSMNDSGIHLS